MGILFAKALVIALALTWFGFMDSAIRQEQNLRNLGGSQSSWAQRGYRRTMLYAYGLLCATAGSAIGLQWVVRHHIGGASGIVFWVLHLPAATILFASLSALLFWKPARRPGPRHRFFAWWVGHLALIVLATSMILVVQM